MRRVPIPPALLAIAWLAALTASTASAELFLFDVEIETGLRFPAIPGAVATDTDAAPVRVYGTPAFPSYPEVSSITLPPVSLLSTLPTTQGPSPRTGLLVDLVQRPDLQGETHLLFGNISGALGGGTLSPAAAPHTGGVTLCLLVAPLPPCASSAQLDLALGGTTALGAPVGLGVGGVLSYTVSNASSLRVSVLGAPYTVNTVSVANRTANGQLQVFTAHGFAHGPMSDSSSFLEANGVLQLVTATRIRSEGGFPDGIVDDLPSISSTRIRFFPEPRVTSLFAAGAALLAWLGWRRRR
jgi:hypothetical protein